MNTENIAMKTNILIKCYFELKENDILGHFMKNISGMRYRICIIFLQDLDLKH